ncbi:Immunoglobulin-like domain [Trinorchestia longiramus]|nr:Immunoglobulin-like domain [Trinorchestia longiramus]
MYVVGSRLQPPLLKVSRDLHEPTDLITVGCEPQPTSVLAPPPPTITWFIDGRKVPPGMMSKYGHSLDGRYRGVSVNLHGQQVVEAGGSVQLECQVSLGRLLQRTTRTIRVRMEHRSLASAFSRAGLSLEPTSQRRTLSVAVELLLLALLALRNV